MDIQRDYIILSYKIYKSAGAEDKIFQFNWLLERYIEDTKREIASLNYKIEEYNKNLKLLEEIKKEVE